MKDVHLADPRRPSAARSASDADASTGSSDSDEPSRGTEAVDEVEPVVRSPKPLDGPDTADTPVVRRPPRNTEPVPRRSPSQVFRSLLVEPDTRGPRVRLGVFWFFLLLAAVTSSRSWTAVLVAAVAAIAAYQVVRAWRVELYELPEPDASGRQPAVPPGAGRAEALVAGLAAALVPLAAGFSVGLAGLLLVFIAVLVGLAWYLLDMETAATVAIGATPPAIAAGSIVLAVNADLWAGIFLVVAVSFYEAGNFLLGAEAAKRWEGPVGGMFGVMAVTFTVATVGTGDFSRGGWWVAGTVVALTCPLGGWLATALLPTPETRARGLRRLDSYLVSGPAFLVTYWLMGA